MSEESRWAELRGRLDRIESRLESAEASLQPLEGARRILDDLEHRLAALEQRADRAVRKDTADDEATPAPSTPTARAAAPARSPAEQQNVRRELRDLAAAYRERLGEIRSEYRHDLGNPERREKMREASQWYRTERRRLLTGEEPSPDATAE